MKGKIIKILLAITTILCITGCSQQEGELEDVLKQCKELYMQESFSIEYTQDNKSKVVYNKSSDIEQIITEIETVYIKTKENNSVSYYKWQDTWVTEENVTYDEIVNIKNHLNIQKESYEWVAEDTDSGYIYTGDSNKQIITIECDNDMRVQNMKYELKDVETCIDISVNSISENIKIPEDILNNAIEKSEYQRTLFTYSEEQKWDFVSEMSKLNTKTATKNFTFNVKDNLTRIEFFYNKTMPTVTLTSPSGEEYQMANKSYPNDTSTTLRKRESADCFIYYAVLYLETKEAGEWQMTVTTTDDNKTLMAVLSDTYKGWENQTREIRTVPLEMIFFFQTEESAVAYPIKNILKNDKIENIGTIQSSTEAPVTNNSEFELNTEGLIFPLALLGLAGVAFLFIKQKEKMVQNKQKDEVKRQEKKKEKMLSEEEELKMIEAVLAKTAHEYKDDVTISTSTEPTYIENNDANIIYKNDKFENQEIEVQNEAFHETVESADTVTENCLSNKNEMKDVESEQIENEKQETESSKNISFKPTFKPNISQSITTNETAGKKTFF